MERGRRQGSGRCCTQGDETRQAVAVGCAGRERDETYLPGDWDVLFADGAPVQIHGG